MVDYQYTYLIGSLILLGFWLLLYFIRNENRKQMLFISIPVGIFGLIFSFPYNLDWWQPLTFTSTIVGIEDLIFSFSLAGIAAVLYEQVYRKKIKLKFFSKSKINRKKLHLYYFFISGVVLFYFLFFVLKINTFLSTVFMFSIFIALILARRPDLIKDSLFSSLLLVLFMVVIFFVIEIISPGVVQEFWHFPNTPEQFFLGIPIDDFIFYLLFGAVIGPLYEYWLEGRVVNKK